jgi:hypothetical protein
MNNILDLIDFERRGEYVLADVKSATWFFERGEYVLADVQSATWFFECKELLKGTNLNRTELFSP